MKKSFLLACPDARFMEDFKEISYTPYEMVDKSQLAMKLSPTSYDSGFDMEIDSNANEFGFSSSTSRKNVATLKVSVDLEGPIQKQSSPNKSTHFSIIESVKKTITLSPRFRTFLIVKYILKENKLDLELFYMHIFQFETYSSVKSIRKEIIINVLIFICKIDYFSKKTKLFVIIFEENKLEKNNV